MRRDPIADLVLAMCDYLATVDNPKATEELKEEKRMLMFTKSFAVAARYRSEKETFHGRT